MGRRVSFSLLDSKNIGKCLKTKECSCLKCEFLNGCYNLNEKQIEEYILQGVLYEYDISHSYSNDIWCSDLNIRNIITTTSIVSEISNTDIQNAYKELYFLCSNKNFLNAADKDAKEETLEVLNFLNEFKNKETIIIFNKDA